MSQKKKDHLFEKRESHAYRSRTDPLQYIVITSLTDTWNGPGEVFEEDGIVFERTEHVEIDVTQIPDHVRDSLAKATLEAVQRFLRQPGGRELLEKEAARRKKNQKDMQEKKKAQQGRKDS